MSLPLILSLFLLSHSFSTLPVTLLWPLIVCVPV
jgi:hypothetical protein